jgi:hypothetical protein
MSKHEKFGFFAAVIGFIVNAVQILGFVFGFLTIPPSLGFLSNPFVLAISTYFSSLLFICGLLYYLIQRAKIGWKRRRRLPRRNSSQSYEGLEQLNILLWLPTAALWGIGMIKYFWFYFFGSADFTQEFMKADFPIQLFVWSSLFGYIFMFMPGFYLPSIAKTLDDFFDPKE